MADQGSLESQIPSNEQLRLHCGEMTLGEIRACRAGYRLAFANAATASEVVEVCIVCHPNGGDDLRFVEAEVGGKSISFPWRDRSDGLVELVVSAPRAAPAGEAWKIIEEMCVITEAIVPNANDVRGTIDRLIDYHVGLGCAGEAVATVVESTSGIGHAWHFPSGYDETVDSLQIGTGLYAGAPPASVGADAESYHCILRAADLLDGFRSALVRYAPIEDIKEWPYHPEITDVAEQLRRIAGTGGE